MTSPTAAHAPIGISELNIENFRGTRSLELKFLDPSENASDIVVFGGLNGSGKTSLPRRVRRAEFNAGSYP